MNKYLLSIALILCSSQSAETTVKTYDEEIAEHRLKATIVGAWATIKNCLEQSPAHAISDHYTPRYHKLFNSSDLVSLQDILLHEGDMIYTQPVPEVKKSKSYTHCDVSGGSGVEERIQERNHMIYRLCTGTVHAYSLYKSHNDNPFTEPIVEFFEYSVSPSHYSLVKK